MRTAHQRLDGSYSAGPAGFSFSPRLIERDPHTRFFGDRLMITPPLFIEPTRIRNPTALHEPLPTEAKGRRASQTPT